MSYEERLDITIKNAGLQFFGEEVPEEDITVLDLKGIGSMFIRTSTRHCFLFVTPPVITEGEIEIKTCFIRL